MNTWLSLIPPVVTIALAIFSKRIIPSLVIGLLIGGFLKTPHLIGGFETSISYIIKTVTDAGNFEVLLFLFLFSGLIKTIQQSGGIKAFAQKAAEKIKSKKGVFYTLWGLIPVTFIDCGFRVVGGGSITKPLSKKQHIVPERLAFQLNNTASPVVELIPIATTFVGFNVGIIQQGLSNAQGAAGSAYAILLQSIPLQFFSIVVLVITFLNIYRGNDGEIEPAQSERQQDKKEMKDKGMGMMDDEEPAIRPKLLNLVVPLMMVIGLSIFLFWYFGRGNAGGGGFFAAIAATEPNKAMLVALFIVLLVNSFLYALQGYKVKKIANDVLKGGNEMMHTLAILITAWSMASVTQDLGLGEFIEGKFGQSVSGWILPVSLFILTGTITYFIGSSWGAASLIMPFALPLAATAGVSLPLCVAAVITGGTFGDITSPVAGMTNMAANITGADHPKYITYASKYNFLAAGITVVLFIVAGLL